MANRIKILFIILVLAQGFHFMEEYFGRLWDELPYIRSITGLVSNDPGTGFLIINTGFVLFGSWCWLVPIRKGFSYAPGLIWFWTLIELMNGIIHSFWGVYEGGYIPGLVTAPFLLALSVYLSLNMIRNGLAVK